MFLKPIPVTEFYGKEHIKFILLRRIGLENVTLVFHPLLKVKSFYSKRANSAE